MSTKMKISAFALLLASTGAMLAAEPAPATKAPLPPGSPEAPVLNAAAKASGPKIALATNTYDFGRVSSGEMVKHTFTFTNIGDAVLEIMNVQPTCGCTTAGDWTHKVEPGQTGTIPLQFNTANYSAPVTKNITVTCNDKTQPNLTLTIKGTVWKPVEVNPQFAVMNVPVDSPVGASTTVRIINHLDEPLMLEKPVCNNKAFETELRTNVVGKEYEVVVKLSPPLNPGNVQAQVSLKTSSSKFPLVNFTAWANVQPPVTVVPMTLSIPTTPLNTKVTSAITIQGNSTNLLELSEPLVNAKDVDIQLRPLQAGRSYSAILTFPQGFEPPPGQQLEFTVKSSHPSLPLIKVPINPLPKQAAPATPTVPIKAVHASTSK
jgi:hypothetical protein